MNVIYNCKHNITLLFLFKSPLLMYICKYNNINILYIIT